jgi:putative endonuclease
MKKYFLYILATHRNGALYLGVTSNLVHRLWQHRAGQVPGYKGASLLVWFEDHPDLRTTLRRQQAIDRLGHASRLALIERTNPHWNNLYDALLTPRLPTAEAA